MEISSSHHQKYDINLRVPEASSWDEIYSRLYGHSDDNEIPSVRFFGPANNEFNKIA